MGKTMEYVKATKDDAEEVFQLVQESVSAVYLKYYPREVVDFFSRLHSREKILEGIKHGYVDVLRDTDRWQLCRQP